MTDASPIAAILACAVPVAAGVVVFKRPLAAAWDGPVCRELRNSHWSVRAVALAILCMATVHAFEKGGGTNAIQSAESGPTNAVAVAASTNAVESATDAESLARALEDLDEAEAIRLGLEPQPAAAGVPLLPAWYQYDPADADQDGMPDLWETWTRSDPATFDSHLDPDDDGLNALYEFWNQTDPRTADTDGDGFPDGFESSFYPPVTNMNPLVKADFTPVEPDANSDGIPDLWEGSGFLYGFHDSNHDGFDDVYATYFLPAASDANFDVLVDVRSSRTAALVWPTPTGDLRMVLPPTATGTVVRLRLPFGEDQALRLLPAPEGVAPPAGQLWKGRLRVSFLARTGQTAAGTCLVAADGAIVQRVATRESAVVRFPDAPASQPLSGGTSDDGTSPLLTLVYRRLGIQPAAAGWHFVGELVGPFAVTNIVGGMPREIEWTAEYATVSAAYDADTAFLTVAEVPPPGATVSITAACRLDDATVVTRRLPVPRCPQRNFGLSSATRNFSPHLGETASFAVELPGCSHFWQSGWLEAEVVRETTTGRQHVGWLDMDAQRAGAQKRVHCDSGGRSVVWDGIATESASLADAPDLFTGGTVPFHRALPAVVAGEPVPPPYHTVVFRYRDADADNAGVIGEDRATVYVPQVVRITWDADALEACEVGFHTQGSAEQAIPLYQPGPTGSGSLAQTLPGIVSSIFPSAANIRVVQSEVLGRHKLIVIKTGTVASPRGLTATAEMSFRNRTSSGTASVYLGGLHGSMLNAITRMNAQEIAAVFPMRDSGLLTMLSKTIAHELGHLLGLVDAAMGGTAHAHNRPPYGTPSIMDPGSEGTLEDELNGSAQWRSANQHYLEFVIPGGNP